MLFSAQPELGHESIHLHGVEDPIDFADKGTPHHTHSMMQLRGSESTIDCERYGSWSKNICWQLLNHCEGLKAGCASKLRLLQGLPLLPFRRPRPHSHQLCNSHQNCYTTTTLPYHTTGEQHAKCWQQSTLRPHQFQHIPHSWKHTTPRLLLRYHLCIWDR